MYKPEFMNFIISTAQAQGQYEEMAKRLKFTPFDNEQFLWCLLYQDGPHFFALRDLLRQGGYQFTVIENPLTLTSLNYTAILTPWSHSKGPEFVKIRGQQRPLPDMGLYYEAGDWDCPQQNFLFDWNDTQAWGYLIHRGLVTLEDVCEGAPTKLV